MCWQGECETCSKVELLVPNKLLGSTRKLQQWEVVFNLKNSPNGEGIENIDPSPSNLTKSLQFVGWDDVIVKEVYEMLALSFKTGLPHINTKQIQEEEFEKDRADPTKQTCQIDYATAYQYMCQDEVWGALWFRESINHKPVHLCTNIPDQQQLWSYVQKSKEKFSNWTFLKYLYDNTIPKIDEVEEEIICSDGPT